ncbi:MAG: hypothetical protein CMJ42_18960 [Phyllobacteriaceae bacterium]|nr:hypothetical protein [Phyllobacteriaceae bacterium]MBA92013.1 hypothetical protein [Phyllobacteriaceae bacterium]
MDGLFEVIAVADLAALSAFVAAWLAFELAVDHTPLRHRSLSGLMAHGRREWMLVMAERDMRMVDTAVLGGLQQGAAYFGTVAMLAIGGCFAAMGATEQALRLFEDLPLVGAISRSLFELKLVGLTLIYVYAFFKFGWSYRLFNYCSILVGGVQQPDQADSATRRRQALRAGEMNVLASRHFTAGQRALFMALAYLGWFAGPLALLASTVFVIAVLVRRQFFSNARRVLLDER